MMQPVAPCKLCKNVASLEDSHIISKWVYRRIKRSANGEMIVRVDDGVATYNEQQFSQYMLCRPCEEWLAPWETYVSGIAAQVDGTFPALNAARPLKQLDVGTFADVSSLDTMALARFGVSVLWRASASTLPAFARAGLGAHHDRVGGFVRSLDTALPHYMIVAAHLLDAKAPAPDVNQIVTVIASERLPAFDLHHFAICGIWFRIIVGDGIPESYRERCLVRSRVALVSDGMAFFEHTAPTILNADRKGVFAKTLLGAS